MALKKKKNYTIYTCKKNLLLKKIFWFPKHIMQSFSLTLFFWIQYLVLCPLSISMKSSFGDGNDLQTLSLMIMAALNLTGNWNYLNSKSKFLKILEMNKFSFLSVPVGIVTSMIVTWYLLHNFRGLKSLESWWASQFLQACKEEHQLIEECWGTWILNSHHDVQNTVDL